jgi:hypothetical protein
MKRGDWRDDPRAPSEAEKILLEKGSWMHA